MTKWPLAPEGECSGSELRPLDDSSSCGQLVRVFVVVPGSVERVQKDWAPANDRRSEWLWRGSQICTNVHCVFLRSLVRFDAQLQGEG